MYLESTMLSRLLDLQTCATNPSSSRLVSPCSQYRSVNVRVRNTLYVITKLIKKMKMIVVLYIYTLWILDRSLVAKTCPSMTALST